jgi:hypothetical protein
LREGGRAGEAAHAAADHKDTPNISHDRFARRG